MQLNLRKIDERIQRLQEIKRIASDPELVTMLFEFIAAEDENRTETAPAPKADPVVVANGDTEVATHADASGIAGSDHADLVKQILKGSDSLGNDIWNRKRI